MDNIWDIRSSDEQEMFLIFEEGQEVPIPHAADDARLEIVSIDNGPDVIYGPQAILGSVHKDPSNEAQVVLSSDQGIRYVGQVGQGMRSFTSNARFSSPDRLYERKWYKIGRVRVTFERDPNIDQWKIPVFLPLFRIHRPPRAGCTTEATFRTTDKTEVSAAFEFPGIKGGGGQGFTTTLAAMIHANSTCMEEVVPATLLVEHGATLVNGQPVAYGVRYQLVDAAPSHSITRPVPSELDGCKRAPSLTPQPIPQFWWTFDKTAVPPRKNKQDVESVTLGLTGYVNVGLGAVSGSVPLKFSIEMKRTLELEVEMKTTLNGGAQYLRFPVSPSAGQPPVEICWSILDKGGSPKSASRSGLGDSVF